MSSDNLSQSQFYKYWDKAYHVTDAKLKPGDKIVPYTALHGAPDPDRSWHQGDHAWRADRVWVTPYRVDSMEAIHKYTYEVTPAPDAMHLGHRADPKLDSRGHNQWHASEATVVKKLRRRKK